MSLEVWIDPDLCMGAQRCVFLVPEVFEMTARGVAVVRDPRGRAETEVVEAARQCPNFAISVWRDGEVLVGEE